jgi:hypothetical protein
MKSNENASEKNVGSVIQSKIMSLLKIAMKSTFCIAVFLGVSQLFARMSNINGKELPEEYFSNGVPSIIGLFDSEFFMGVIFVITLSVVVYVLYLLWQLHEIAVHRSEKIKSHQANLVFALSLCGLFLHKSWWVLAIVIAFTNWQSISHSLSTIIRNGRKPATDNQEG